MKTVQEVQQRAYHEAGHAVVAIALHVPVASVTLSETRQAIPRSRVALHTQLQFLLAGGCAEERLTGRPARYDSADVADARAFVRALGGGWTLAHFRYITSAVVEQRWTQITVVARALVSRRQLSGADVRRLAILALEGEHDDRSRT